MMSRLAYALESRLPRDLADLVSQYIDPLSALPPQLVQLSKTWGRIVVARVCGETECAAALREGSSNM